MSENDFSLEGGCACGTLRYCLTAPPLGFYACHCRNCQLQSGSAFVLSGPVVEAAFSFVEGTPARVEWTSDAGNSRYGLFCGDCGSRILNGQTPTIGVLSLRGGTLDDPRWARPAAHIWTSSALDWMRFDASDITAEKQPSDYGPISERYRQLTADLHEQ